MRGTPADRFVVAVKPLLGAVGVERRGVRRDKPAWRRRWKSSTPKV
jgi:hypothetical protein